MLAKQLADKYNWPKCSVCHERFNASATLYGLNTICEGCYAPRSAGLIGSINGPAWATDEACNGGWSNVARAYEDEG